MISCLIMVGCGKTTSKTPPQSPSPLSFADCFGINTTSYYSGALNCMFVEDLAQYGHYKSISLYTKKSFSFNHIGFKISSQNYTDEKIYVTITFGTHNKWHSYTQYAISSQKQSVDCYYVDGSISGATYFTDSISNPNVSLKDFTIEKGTNVVIYFGTDSGYMSYPACVEYLNAISITDLIIE